MEHDSSKNEILGGWSNAELENIMNTMKQNSDSLTAKEKKMMYKSLYNEAIQLIHMIQDVIENQLSATPEQLNEMIIRRDIIEAVLPLLKEISEKKEEANTLIGRLRVALSKVFSQQESTD